MSMLFVGRMFVTVMLVEEPLSAGVFFSEGRIVPVTVSAAIGAGFRLKWKVILPQGYSKPQKHLFEDGIALQLQIIFSKFNRNMSVSQVKSRAHQVVRLISGHVEHFFWSRHDSDQGTVSTFQKIAVAQHRTAWEEQGNLSSVVERGSQTALLPKLKGQNQSLEVYKFSRPNFTIGVAFNPDHLWCSGSFLVS